VNTADRAPGVNSAGKPCESRCEVVSEVLEMVVLRVGDTSL